MYNFLDTKLSPKVTSQTPSMDNYEVTNLISENCMTRARGFLAYSTIKPPVEIIFELICFVNVHYIILWTTVGAQKCTAVEIFAKNANTNFISIGHARFQNNGIVFCNSRIYSLNKPPPNIDKSFYLSYFKQNSFRAFTTANLLKICILQTEKSVPCLGKIEIWGKPSKICSPITISTITKLMSKVANDVDNEAKSSSSSSLSTVDNFEIPDEFKDSLTFEIMSLPVTLPSGNSVDQSTLEKYIATETSYGRLPSDPFTGQKFTDTRKPLFNAALKSRIDMFLLQNSEKPETFTLKRTVGKTNAIINKKTNNYVQIKEDNNSHYNKKIKLENELSIKEPKLNDPDEILNEAIRKTISSSSFIRFTTEEKECNETVKCVKCENCEHLYTIPCNHLYCRDCLNNVYKDLKCSFCDKTFCKNEIKKFHV